MSGNQSQGAGPASMSLFNKEVIFMVLQFMYEKGLHETAHRLERDSQLYFNLKYFEELILAGQWAEVEWYLRGYFKDVRGNSHGLKLIFETYKQNFYEALYWHQKEEALNILDTEFRSILSPNEDIYKELHHLFSLMDFREHPLLKEWDNPQKARSALCVKMRNLVLRCPDLMDKICFPTIPPSRLQSLVTHSFNWQHSLCERRLPNPAMATLLTDHNCSELMLPPSLMSESLFHRPAQNFTPLPSLSLSLGRSSFELTSHFTADPSRLAIDVRGAANNGESSQQESMHLDSQNIYSIAPAKRISASESSTSESAHQIVPRKSGNMKKLPTSLAMELRLDSAVVSMDFHPIQQTLLLVGTSSGEVSIWDLSSKERIHKKCFGLLNNQAFSAVIQDALDKEDGFFSVRRVLWSTDGCHFVVAYCKHLVQMYKFSGKRDSLRCTFEIDAHKGGLNDIAFSQPPVFIVTSGDDGAIRVWCSETGLRLHTFGGDHSAPVLSICPRLGGFHQDIISASSDGKIKSWRFDKNLKVEPEHEFEGPICSSVSLAATTDGSRLFLCGTIKDVDGTGSPFLVEWGELNEGIIKCYLGLSTQTDEALQFDMANDHILAIGDDSIIKFWNVDKREPLYYVDAGGGLPTFPRIRFNNSGSLLAVSAKDNFIKILASRSDQEMLSPSHLPLTTETSSHTSVATVESHESNVETSTSAQRTYALLTEIIELERRKGRETRPNTSVAIVESHESNVETSTSAQRTYALLTDIIELERRKGRGPNTSVAIVESESNVETSTSAQRTHALLTEIIELERRRGRE